MKLAIMQPYFFPYIGYFQLIHAVDKFVFYDDVNFINRGWINRNRILINGDDSYFTIQLKEASQNKLIKDIVISDNRTKLLKTIELAYKKSPCFKDVWPLVEHCMASSTQNISQLAMETVKEVSEYIGLTTQFEISSQSYPESKGMDKAERLIDICKKNCADTYINPIGGVELYSKDVFANHNITLQFIQSKEVVYQQGKNEFVPWLSIIDVLMFNSKEEVIKLLSQFELK